MSRIEIALEDRGKPDALERAVDRASRKRSIEIAVAAERERCAKIAEAHKGSAARKRHERGQKLSKFGLDNSAEIEAEERGEDIAAEMIARAIREAVT